MENNNEQQKIVNEIRSSYVPKTRQQSKLEELRALDAKVRRPADIFAYTFGTVGALVLGVGMCLAMKVIGDMFALGVVVGVVGIAMVCANYFLHKGILNSRKKKYADQIMSLSDELLNREGK